MREYQGFAISNFRTGYDEAVEPWLLPRDGYQILKNAHLYRGVLEKIAGYDVYARMSYTQTVEADEVIDGIRTVFTGNLNFRPSTETIIARSTVNAGATISEVFTYDSDISANQIALSSNLGGSGVVDLIAPFAFALNFNTAPVELPVGGNLYNVVTVTYDYLANPGAGNTDIMGIKPYYGRNRTQEILVFNTRRAGKVVTLVSQAMIDAAGTDNGITEIPHEVQAAAITIAPPFDGITLIFTGTVAGAPLVPGSVEFTVLSNVPAVLGTITDNGHGLLQGALLDVTGDNYINYATGAFTITFLVAPAATDTVNSDACVYGDVFTGDFTDFFSVVNFRFLAFITNGLDPIRYYDGMCLNYLDTNITVKVGAVAPYDITTCLHVQVQRQRLLLIAPTSLANGPLPNVIYYSRAEAPLDFTNNGFLPASTSQPIVAQGIINSDLIIKFSNSEYIFRYTADEFRPFRFDSTNNIWRCDAPFSTINYDSYLTAVGKPAITASDGVNIQRKDEIIPDFTLNARETAEGPIISIDQTSIGQCYGERFDDFKEGWMCFKSYASSTNQVDRADNVLAFNYLDETYAVYTFPFNCLGFGTVTASKTWGNNEDTWEDADYAWNSFYNSLDALVDLAGDRFGVVYVLGNANTVVSPEGVPGPLKFEVITKNFNPFIEDGELCRLGYIDLFVSADPDTKLRVQVYANDTMTLDAQGNPTGPYYETTLVFNGLDSFSTTQQSKIWKRVYVGAVAREHTVRLYQDAADFTDDTLDQPVRIHSMVLYMKPAGRIFG